MEPKNILGIVQTDGIESYDLCLTHLQRITRGLQAVVWLHMDNCATNHLQRLEMAYNALQR